VSLCSAAFSSSSNADETRGSAGETGGMTCIFPFAFSTLHPAAASDCLRPLFPPTHIQCSAPVLSKLLEPVAPHHELPKNATSSKMLTQILCTCSLRICIQFKEYRLSRSIGTIHDPTQIRKNQRSICTSRVNCIASM